MLASFEDFYLSKYYWSTKVDKSLTIGGGGGWLTSEEVEEDVGVHVVQRGLVDPQGRGHRPHVEAKAFQQVQKVHFLA